MQYHKSFQTSNNNPFSSIIGVVLGILFLLGLFFVARFIFTILYYLSPVMLIAALIIDYKTVTGYGKWLVDKVKTNPLLGIGGILLTILAFPLVSLFLLGKALFKKKVREVEQEVKRQREGEYVDFEELNSEPMDLKRLEEQFREHENLKRRRGNYDDFFDSQS
ncbi:hypothetical protein [Phaeodactylibacter sp.]|uniref:hypothetical protein n=1 Tax=Phaeodactylibacter sp. TaxID=1940289 RepID=UPI0025D63FFC|nr:hypothetical protein [Phaeodactylibacter sp.]MCI4649948.1 hypothetical protein [Phaeodactylibacter sp.]MCI5090178.1 hypothetical protein [Phaeodactylibacter sp.]